MSKEYYTPEIEDLYQGYECEIKVPVRIEEEWKTSNFVFGKISSIYPRFEWIDFQNTVHSFSNTFKLQIRTSYLTKEQIENENWRYNGGNVVDEYIFPSQNGRYKLFVCENNLIEFYHGEHHLLFSGKCPSINEFRKICKLLEI